MRITETSDLWWKSAVIYCLDVETFLDWNEDGILSGNEVRVGATRETNDEEDYDQTRRPEFSNWTVRGFENFRDAEIDLALVDVDRHAAVLRDPLLGDVEVGHDLDA